MIKNMIFSACCFSRSVYICLASLFILVSIFYNSPLTYFLHFFDQILNIFLSFPLLFFLMFPEIYLISPKLASSNWLKTSSKHQLRRGRGGQEGTPYNVYNYALRMHKRPFLNVKTHSILEMLDYFLYGIRHF